jgi:hypothetical protein
MALVLKEFNHNTFYLPPLRKVWLGNITFVSNPLQL